MDTTIRASWLAPVRCAHATCTRLVPPASTEAATEGSVLVRNCVPDIAWSNGVIVATWTVFLDGNVLPKSSDRATRIDSGLLEVLNWRQTAYTFPLAGSMARFVPWLIELDSESLSGLDQVFPQSSERENMIFVLVEPVKRLHTRYTLPARTVCEPPSPGNRQLPPPERGTSTAIHVLSRNCPDVPVSTTTVRWYCIESPPARAVPFSFWFVSKKVETKTPPLFVPRLKAMPL